MNNQIVKNTTFLYAMTFIKVIAPLLTLPYFTRVFSVNGYAVISYVKSTMIYVQMTFDFGFELSATKEIVKIKHNREKISNILSECLIAKMFLILPTLMFCLIISESVTLLKGNVTFVLLSYLSVVLTIFLPDYLFRGLEKMQIITIRFFITRVISTMLVFVFIKSEQQILLIPVFDILGVLVAILWTWREIKKMGYGFIVPSIKKVFYCLRSSFTYFLSNASTTVFGAFNTMVIGILLCSRDVAFWNVTMQLISGVQVLYTPIISGIYPHMIKTKDIKFILKILYIVMPIIIIGTCIFYFFGDMVLLIIGGDKYLDALFLLRILLPLLIFSFPAMLLGWPCLGAINKQKKVTISTIASALAQVFILCILICVGKFNLVNVAISRIVSEMMLLMIRGSYCLKYRKDF